MKRASDLLALGVCAMLASCASPGGTDTVVASRGSDCMFNVNLRNWRPLDDRNLVLFESARRPYHVELTRPAIGLTRDAVIGVYDRDGRICPYGGDAIVVDNGVPDRIPIRAIRRLDEGQLEALYVQFGLVSPAGVTTEAVELEATEAAP